MSKREVEASEEALQRKKEEIAFKVVQYYLMVGTAAGYVGVAEKALEDAREHQRLAELRYSTGLGLYSDTLGPARWWRKPGRGSSVPRRISAWQKGRSAS